MHFLAVEDCRVVLVAGEIEDTINIGRLDAESTQAGNARFIGHSLQLGDEMVLPGVRRGVLRRPEPPAEPGVFRQGDGVLAGPAQARDASFPHAAKADTRAAFRSTLNGSEGAAAADKGGLATPILRARSSTRYLTLCST